MSLTPDETPETNTLSLYEALSNATSNMHYWQKARRQYTDSLAKAQRDVGHADEAIAEYAQKMNEALTKLGFLNAPDAEVSK